MSQAVLVTGGAGYIGSHACKVLAAAGWLPVAFDNLSRGRRAAVRWGPLIEGDLADRARLCRALAEHRVEAVMHFAAYAYVGESVADPALYYRNNLEGTLSLLEAMRETVVGEIVFSSTCATYGIPDRVPIGESAPQRPVNPYGETKLAIERALHWYGAAYGLRSAALRYFNAAGADPDGEIGERHDPETHLIPNILKAARAGAAVRLFGDDYPTPDGTTVRDYVHVADLAEAHVAALRFLAEGGESQPMNLGAGEGLSVMQILRAAERVLGRPIPHEMLGRRPGDPASLVADIGRAKARLGFAPSRSDVDTLIRTAATFEGLHPEIVSRQR
jgi:UDP-arabinose 4-epimerase